MKLLLTSVLGPYGVDDEYGRKENLMEVLHNQVTREQGVFSMRFNQETYSLYLMAENLTIPTAVLDFPSQKRFIREIKNGYDYIGISFIYPNLKKVLRMARLIREHSPNSKIILGGHGTSIENIEKQIPCDFICRGEGIRYLRQLFGDCVDAPIRHPLRYSSFNRYILGTPVSNKQIPEGIIMAGVGCVNGCHFCATSHFFQKEYIPFINSGVEFFDLCRQYEDQMGITDFFVLDENFFKSEDRAKELMELMEKHKKAYSFNIFSSADTIMNLGVDFIQRLGIDFLWIGVESQKEIFQKNREVDFHQLVQALRDQGISVLTSGILFLDHHTKKTIHEDIDYLVRLQADFIQFMGLGVVPGTTIYKSFQQQDKIHTDIPIEDRHGQKGIWFKHPHFTPKESESYLINAFKKDFYENGPSILRMADTYLRGAIASEKMIAGDDFMKYRHQQRKMNALNLYPVVKVLKGQALNPKVNAYAQRILRQYQNYFGKGTIKISYYAAVMNILLLKEKIRSKLIYNNLRQPKTLFNTYRI